MLDFTISRHYSLLSVALYVFLGIIGCFCFSRAKSDELITNDEPGFKNKYLFAWWFVWVTFAAFRYVGNGIGGTDSPLYISYFQNCNGTTINSWFEHVEGDLGFKWVTKLCRFFVSDFRIYYLVMYSFMFFAYTKFVKAFTPPRTSFVPFVLCFFLFLRSWSSMRSNFAIAWIALGLVFIIEKKWTYAYLIAFFSILIHKSAVIYVMVIPFCQFFINRKVSVKMAVLLVLGSCLIGRALQTIFIQYATVTDLNGAYGHYAQKSIGSSFFDNAWKIAFEQILLALAMLLKRKDIGKDHDERDTTRLKIIWTICIYDFILIPINFIIGSWRGYEFFYLARIVMWGEIIYQISKSFTKRSRKILSVILFAAFISWMIFRINHTWEDSGLMPYIFSPLLLLR